MSVGGLQADLTVLTFPGASRITSSTGLAHEGQNALIWPYLYELQHMMTHVNRADEGTTMK